MSQWFESAFNSSASGYPHPDWETIAAGVEVRHPPEEWH